MTPEPQRDGEGVRLSDGQFDALFPFYVALGSDLRLRGAGRSVRRVCPDAVPGVEWGSVFRIKRPENVRGLDEMIAQQGSLFLVEHVGSGLLLRGQMLWQVECGTLWFLGSPWITDAAEFPARGLAITDFAIHDAMVDLVQFGQAQAVGLQDMQRLAERLAARNREMESAERRLLAQERESRKLALVAARTDNAVVVTDAKGCIEWVNAGFTRITGYTLDEVVGRSPGSFLQGPDTDPETVKLMHERLSAGEGFSTEVVNYGKNARKYWLHIEVQPIRGDSGEVVNFMAVERDITDRVHSEQRRAVQYAVSHALAGAPTLRSGLSQVVRAIATSMHWPFGAMWSLDAGLHVLQCLELWQDPRADAGEFVSQTRRLSFMPGVGLPGRVYAAQEARWIRDFPMFGNFPRATAAQAAGFRDAFAFPVRAAGRFLGLIEFFSPSLDEPDEGMLKLFESVGDQIGQFIVRKQVEDALRSTSSLQRAILEGANYSIISAAPDGVIQTFNSAAERMLGYSSAEVVGRSTPAIFHDPEEIAARAAELTLELGRAVKSGFEAFVAKAELGQPDEREWTYVRKDGTRLPVLLSVTALFDEAGASTGYLGVASDLSVRKRDEEKLRATLSELERFNRVMLNREERVLDLKREVNRLRTLGGQPPVYASVATEEDSGPAGI
jgi:PAS domain S-box-containing protein